MTSTEIHDLDDRDWTIIELLRAGIISNSAVAKKLGVSEGMIRQRIKRLREQGILSLRGLINPEILGNRQVVWLGASVVESRLLTEKAEEISRLEDVLSVSIVSGRFDLIIELLLDSHHGLVDFLTEQLSRVEGISRTESFVTLKAYSKFV
jgi:Lrp/AsnC family transcriptional regulator, regulator for asnA, asnC and gidA